MVVSEMTMDTRMAVERVTANSRKRRPTIPPISRRGMKTAISEMLIDEDGETDFLRTLQCRGKGLHAVFHMARDIFHHNDGVIDHKSR